MLQYRQIDGLWGSGQLGPVGRCFEVGDQRRQRIEPGFRVAPEQPGQRGKAVLLQRIDFLVGKFRRAMPVAQPAQRSEGAIALMPPGAPCNLGHFRRGQAALALAVELRQAGKGHMADVKVQPHSDGIGRHQIVDLARLIERYLRVAGLRAHRPHHQRRAAAIAPQHLGHGVDLLGREGDHGAARRQARKFDRAGMAQR